MRARHLYVALRYGVVLLLALCGSACVVVSLQPFVTLEQAEFDPTVLGRWENSKEKISISFEQGNAKRYAVRYREKDQESHFVAVLTTIAGQRFLDYRPDPEDPELKNDTNLAAHLIPSHGLLRVRWDSKALEMAVLNADWFEKHLKQGTPLQVKYEAVGSHPGALGNFDYLVLTAPTEELRTFIATHASEPDFLSEPLHLTRVP